jgi:hypothetical protein
MFDTIVSKMACLHSCRFQEQNYHRHSLRYYLEFCKFNWGAPLLPCRESPQSMDVCSSCKYFSLSDPMEENWHTMGGIVVVDDDGVGTRV